MEEYERDASVRRHLLATRFQATRTQAARSQAARPQASKFLFVNKDRKSKSFSNSRDDILSSRALLQHVRRSRPARLPRKRQPTPKTSTGLTGWRWNQPVQDPSDPPTQNAPPVIAGEAKVLDVDNTQLGTHDSDKDSDIEEIVREREPGVGSATTSPTRTPQINNFNSKRPLSLNRTIKNPNIRLLEPYRARAGVHVSRLVEYYIQVCGPNYIWRPESAPNGSYETFPRTLFQFTMSHSVVLESVLALCQAQLELRARPESHPSKLVMYHRGKALNMIQQKLAGSEVDDALLMAVCAAISYDLVYSNWTSVEAHLKALRFLVSLRGGLDNLGWQGWFAYVYSWAELRWVNHLAQEAVHQPGHRALVLEYPSHPYPTAICRAISKLPLGFQEVAFAGFVSVQVLSFLKRTSEWSTGYTDAMCHHRLREESQYSLNGMRLVNWVVAVLGSCSVTQYERLLCIGLLSYLISFDGQQARHTKGLEDHMVNLKEIYGSLSPSKRPWVIWVAMVIAAAKDSIAAPLPNRWLLLDSLLDEEVVMPWKEVQSILQKFLWNESLDKRWEACWQRGLERRRRRQTEILTLLGMF